jgi:hypothetical protein
MKYGKHASGCSVCVLALEPFACKHICKICQLLKKHVNQCNMKRAARLSMAIELRNSRACGRLKTASEIYKMDTAKVGLTA